MPLPRPKGGKPKHGGVVLRNGEQLEVVQHDSKEGLIDHKTLRKQIKAKFGKSSPSRGLRAGSPFGPKDDHDRDRDRDRPAPSSGIVPPDEPYFFPPEGASRLVDDSGDDATLIFTDDDEANVYMGERFGEPSMQSLLFEFEDDSEVLKASMNLLATPHSEENKEEAIAVIENVQMMCAADYVRLGCAPTEVVNMEDMQAGGGGGLLMGLGDVISGLFRGDAVSREDTPKPIMLGEGPADEVGFAPVFRNMRRRKLFDANMAAHSPLPRRAAGIMPSRLAKSLSAHAPLLPYHFPQHHHRSAATESESESEEAPRRRRLSSSDIEVDPRHMGGMAGRIQKLVDGLRASTGLDVSMVWNAAHGQVRKLRKAHMAENRKHAHAADGGRRAYPPKGGDDIKSPSEGSDSDGDRRALREPHGPPPHAAPPPPPRPLLGADDHDYRHHDRHSDGRRPPPPGPEGGPGSQHLDPEVREHLHDLGKLYRPASPGPEGEAESAQWSHTAALGFDGEGDMCMMNAYLAPEDAPVRMSEGCRQAIDMAEGFRAEYWNEETALVNGGHHAHCHGFLFVVLAFVLGVFLYKRRCSKEAQLRRKVKGETQDMLEMLHRNPEAKAAVEGVLGKAVPPPVSSLPRARFLSFLCRAMGYCSLVFWLMVSSMVVTGSLLDGLTVTEADGSTHGPPGLLVLLVLLVVMAIESAVVVFAIRTCRHYCGQGCCCGTPASAESASSSGSGGSRFGAALTASTGMITSAVASASSAVSAVAATATGAASSSSAPSTSNRRGYAPLGMQANDSSDYDYHPMSGGAPGAEMTTFSNSIPVASAPPAPYAPPHQAQAPVQSRVYYTGVPVSQPPMLSGMRREYQM